MKQPTKYIRGMPLTGMGAVFRISGGLYVYHHHKPQHPGWMLGWPLGCIRSAAQRGELFAAVQNPAYATWLKSRIERSKK